MSGAFVLASLGSSLAYAAPVYSVIALPGLATATGSVINNAGQVAGFTTSGSLHAAVAQNGKTTDLGTLGGGTSSYAYGINDAGQVVGGSAVPRIPAHAFVYQNGVMTDLGTLGGSISYAYGINDAGQIVGYSATSTGGNLAYLYENNLMISLDSLVDASLGWSFSDAYGINDNGDIVAYGCKNGACSTVLLDAIDTNAVPEPGSAPIVLGGILGLAYTRRRAKRR